MVWFELVIGHVHKLKCEKGLTSGKTSDFQWGGFDLVSVVEELLALGPF